jgi:hypothetical protein
LFAVDPFTRRVDRLASVPGRLYLRSDARDGWVAGRWSGGLVLLRLATGDVIRLGSSDGRQPAYLTVAGALIGAVFDGDHASTVRLYGRE